MLTALTEANVVSFSAFSVVDTLPVPAVYLRQIITRLLLEQKHSISMGSSTKFIQTRVS